MEQTHELVAILNNWRAAVLAARASGVGRSPEQERLSREFEAARARAGRVRVMVTTAEYHGARYELEVLDLHPWQGRAGVVPKGGCYSLLHDDLNDARVVAIA